MCRYQRHQPQNNELPKPYALLHIARRENPEVSRLQPELFCRPFQAHHDLHAANARLDPLEIFQDAWFKKNGLQIAINL